MDWNGRFLRIVALCALQLVIVANIHAAPVSASFTPSDTSASYADRLIALIDSAQSQIDISLYGLDDGYVFDALKRAAARGVEIRMILNTAAEDRTSTADTTSSQLEQAGIDVRYVNKTDHHKFMVVDGARACTSSGNWTWDADAGNDEATLWFDDDELVKRFRAEFALQWHHAREFGVAMAFQTVIPTADSILASITDAPGRDAIFTSSNFGISYSDTYGPTFSILPDHQVVADKLVQLINSATKSIHVAVTHLRSRPIAEALIAKKKSNPNLDIEVVLDSQEFISADYEQTQINNRDACLAQATTDSQIAACWDKGFYYSYELMQAGIDVRFKTNAYRWDIDTALQMHSKYMVVDSSVVATGSYNYSNNAEKNSFENLVVLNAGFAPDVVKAYEDNFTSLHNYGRSAGFYQQLMGYIQSGASNVSLQYPVMTLTYSEFDSLKSAVAQRLPMVADNYFKKNARYFSSLPTGLAWRYTDTNELDSVSGDFGSLNFGYGDNGKLSSVNLATADGQSVNESFGYDAAGHVNEYHGPVFNASFGYDSNGLLSRLDYGAGAYTWIRDMSPDGVVVHFSTPDIQDDQVQSFSPEGFLLTSTDADQRQISWKYDANWNPVRVESPARSAWLDQAGPDQFSHVTSDGESVAYDFRTQNRIDLTIDGTVKAGVSYLTEPEPDGGFSLDVNVDSHFVDSGYGKDASVHYVYNAYGRAVDAGDSHFERAAYSGEINSITNGPILEQRKYKDGRTVLRQVSYQGVLLFTESLDYDDLGRIKYSREITPVSTHDYQYDYYPSGALRSVLMDGVEVEHYAYDDWGNRTQRVLPGLNESYHYDNDNRLAEKQWSEPDRDRLVSYAYNRSGQLKQTRYFTIGNGEKWETRSRSYQYNELGQLPSVTWASQERRHVYDPYDRQIATLQNDAVVSRYVYGLDDQPLAEINENGRIVSTFIYGDGDTPIALRKGNREFYIISDVRGSARMVVDISNGDIVQQMQYDAFGSVLADTNPGYTPFGFTGGLYDSRLALVRFGARDYDPDSGRWLAEDPIGFASGDVNFYVYVGNDPINYVDLEGLSRVSSGLSGLTREQAKQALKSAQESYKGTTRVGHSLSKHSGRYPDVWGKMTGSQKTWNTQAMKQMREIFRGPGEFTKVANDKGVVFLEKRLGDGRGLRLNLDYSFKGFID